LLLNRPLEQIPESLAPFDLELTENGCTLVYTYDTRGERTGVTRLLNGLASEDIRFRDLSTRESSLEEIFVSLVRRDA